MVEVLAEMAQKGEASPPALQSLRTGPRGRGLLFCRIHQGPIAAGGHGRRGGAGKPPVTPGFGGQGKEPPGAPGGPGSPEGGEACRNGAEVRDRKEQPVEEFKLQIDALQREQQQLVEEMRRRDPRYAALRYPQPYKARELPLKPGEVLLEYALGDKESYLFRVEPGGKTQVFRLALGQEAMEKRLGAMLAPFRQSVLRREDLARFSITEAARPLSGTPGPGPVRGGPGNPPDHRARRGAGGLPL